MACHLRNFYHLRDGGKSCSQVASGAFEVSSRRIKCYREQTRMQDSRDYQNNRGFYHERTYPICRRHTAPAWQGRPVTNVTTPKKSLPVPKQAAKELFRNCRRKHSCYQILQMCYALLRRPSGDVGALNNQPNPHTGAPERISV